MKQTIATFLLILLLSVLTPVNNVLAHNGIEEKMGQFIYMINGILY